MKNIGLEVRNLLDKVYNLKSNDSVIIKQIESEQEASELKKNDLIIEKTNLINNIDELSNEINLLETDGNLLLNELKKLCNGKNEQVIEKLNITFNPSELCNEFNTELPSKISNLKNDKDTKNNQLKSVEKDLADSLTLIDELSFKKDDAIASKDKLSEYFELSINGNFNITRDILINLLSKFNLNEEEQRCTAKILMFPEDGLYDYNDNITEYKKSGKSFSEVFAEAKTLNNNAEVEIKPISLDIPQVQEVKEVEIKPIALDLPEIPEVKSDELKPINLADFIKVEEPIKEKVVEENIKEEINLKEILSKNNFEYSDFTTRDIEFITDNFDNAVFNKNIKLLKDMGINKDIFVDNIELFIDDQLEEKINLLLGVGKVPFDIYLNPNILIKYDANELSKSINALKESGLDPKKVPLMAY